MSTLTKPFHCSVSSDYFSFCRLMFFFSRIKYIYIFCVRKNQTYGNFASNLHHTLDRPIETRTWDDMARKKSLDYASPFSQSWSPICRGTEKVTA